MIALVFVACLQSSPAVCEERTLTFAEANLTPYRCLMRAQLRLAEWSLTHPQWRISRWGCGRVQFAKKSI